MIEKIIFDFLNEKSIQAYMEEVPEMPEEYVLIEKTGSGGTDGVNHATIAIQSFSTSLFKTAKLNEKVIDIMRSCVKLDSVCKCELNSDYNYTDTQRKKYRYQAVFDITYY